MRCNNALNNFNSPESYISRGLQKILSSAAYT